MIIVRAIVPEGEKQSCNRMQLSPSGMTFKDGSVKIREPSLQSNQNLISAERIRRPRRIIACEFEAITFR